MSCLQHGYPWPSRATSLYRSSPLEGLQGYILWRSSMLSNCLVFHTSGIISSSPAAFPFLIFLRTESSSSWVNGPSLMSTCLLIILVIGSCVTFGGFPSRFSKCCFHSFILSCSALPSTHVVYRLSGYPRLPIFRWVSNFIYLILYVSNLFF